MNRELDQKIEELLNKSKFLTLGTSVSGNSSASNVFFARDGWNLYFFTFNPTRKAEQIRVNPKVQCVVRPDGLDGIKELQIEGIATKVTDPEEEKKARKLILNVTGAFKSYMEDEFLKRNKVIGYYKIKPTVIKYVDFYAENQFEWREFPENEESLTSLIVKGFLRKINLYVRAVRAPFFTVTIVPVALGAAVAYYELGSLNWPIFWLTLLGAVFAHAGTNVANDYSDHVSRNDEKNKLFSPFNGGSRIIQAGLMSPAKVIGLATICFAAAIWIGLHLNFLLHGAYLAISPLIWFGIAGITLGLFYTAAPFQLSYHGWGDIAVMLGFGPIMALGTHYVQTQAIIPEGEWNSLTVLASSLPIAVLAGLILFINGFQDFNADRATGKNTWVVRTANFGEIANYRKPFAIYKISLYFIFIYILALGLTGVVNSEFSTPWILIALLPFIIAKKAISRGEDWLKRWDKQDADRQQMPYELLTVNVSTIGTHLSVGLLMILGYWLGYII